MVLLHTTTTDPNFICRYINYEKKNYVKVCSYKIVVIKNSMLKIQKPPKDVYDLN
jgi:hypothetical protein